MNHLLASVALYTSSPAVAFGTTAVHDATCGKGGLANQAGSKRCFSQALMSLDS